MHSTKWIKKTPKNIIRERTRKKKKKEKNNHFVNCTKFELRKLALVVDIVNHFFCFCWSFRIWLFSSSCSGAYKMEKPSELRSLVDGFNVLSSACWGWRENGRLAGLWVCASSTRSGTPKSFLVFPLKFGFNKFINYYYFVFASFFISKLGGTRS